MVALGQADSDSSIGIESYVWEFFAPLREEEEYQVDGEIISVERKVEPERTYDRIQFCFDLTKPEGGAVARTTVTWHYNRNGGERLRAKA